MKKEKKPFYKRWWVIAIAAFLFIGFINGLMNPYDEEEHKAEAEQQEAEEKAEAEKKAEEEKKQVEKEKKEESKPKTIELDDFAMAEFSIEDMTATIEDEILRLSFRWINQSGDKAPFTSLAYLDVHQGDELLDEVSGSYDVDNKTGILFQNADGGFHSVDLEFELKNENDIDLLFGSTIEGANQKEEQTIELN